MDAPVARAAAAPARPRGAAAPTRRWRSDSRWRILVAAYALLMLFPSELVLAGPLKSNGGPVRLLGLLSVFLLVAGFLRWGRTMPLRPVGVVLLISFGYEVFAWSVAQRRPLSSGGVAYNDRQLLAMTSVVGLALLCAVVVTTMRRAHVLLACLVGGASVSSLAGILQSTGVMGAWAEVIALPFFTTHVGAGGITDREGLSRVSGATSHPIEFAVTLALVLPFAIHLARHALTAAARRWALLGTVVIMLGFPLGLSRSGLLTLLVAVLLYCRFLPGRQRALLLGGGAAIIAAAVVVAPQIVATFQQLIGGAAQDNSITGRLDDYPRAFAQWAASPWLGGAPADISVVATVLDNQWLATLVSRGVVGVVALAFLFLAPAVVAGRAASDPAAGPAARSLNGAIASMAVAATISAGTFDFLAFQQATFAVVMLAALAGIGRREAALVIPAASPTPSAPSKVRDRAGAVRRSSRTAPAED